MTLTLKYQIIQTCELRHYCVLEEEHRYDEDKYRRDRFLRSSVPEAEERRERLTHFNAFCIEAMYFNRHCQQIFALTSHS